MVGSDHPPFIIAEMSGNHNQSLEQALKIVDAAAAAGVDALKLQTYTADTMTIDVDLPAFRIDNPDSLWAGQSLYALYQQAYTPWEWHAPIIERCKALDLLCFSTPFDATAVEFLEAFDMPCYKIASFENTDHDLIRKAAATGKPLIISSGMATLTELQESVAVARDAGCQALMVLKCTSAYPAQPKDCHLRTMVDMQAQLDCMVGLSDHTLGTTVPVAAVALGATVIEKHFVLDRDAGGVDAAFSLNPDEMQALVSESRIAWEALGNVQYGPSSKAEHQSMQFRRSLYIVEDLPAGTTLEAQHVRAIRPGFGLPVKHRPQLLGKTLKQAVVKGTPAAWELVEA